MSETVRSIIGNRRLIYVAPDASVTDACIRMLGSRIGCLAVVADGQLAGVLSERDVIVRAVAEERNPPLTPVSAVMTPDPWTIDIDDTLTKAAEIMGAGVFRHLPVLDDGYAVGMISVRDFPSFAFANRYQDGLPAGVEALAASGAMGTGVLPQ